jgi:hypothetical protein
MSEFMGWKEWGIELKGTGTRIDVEIQVINAPDPRARAFGAALRSGTGACYIHALFLQNPISSFIRA